MSPVKSVSRQLSTAFEEQIYPTFGGPPTADLNIFVVVNRVFTVHPSPRFILVILDGKSWGESVRSVKIWENFPITLSVNSSSSYGKFDATIERVIFVHITNAGLLVRN